MSIPKRPRPKIWSRLPDPGLSTVSGMELYLRSGNMDRTRSDRSAPANILIAAAA